MEIAKIAVDQGTTEDFFRVIAKDAMEKESAPYVMALERTSTFKSL